MPRTETYRQSLDGWCWHRLEDSRQGEVRGEDDLIHHADVVRLLREHVLKRKQTLKCRVKDSEAQAEKDARLAARRTSIVAGYQNW